MRPAVIFFNRVFAPDPDATAVLLGDLALSLSERMEVTVVSGGNTQTDRPYRHVGLGRGSRLLRGAIGKALDYGWYLIRAVWFLFTLGRLPGHRIQLMFWSDPPFLEIAGGWVARLRGIPYCAVIQDRFLEGIASEGLLARDSLVFRALRNMEILALKGATRVVCISTDTQSVLAAAGIGNTTVIQNWAPRWLARGHDVEALARLRTAAQVRLAQTQPGAVIIKYMGNLGFACDLDLFSAALEQIPATSKLIFVFQARGRRLNELKEVASKNPRVKLVEQVPEHRLLESYLEADFQLILTPEDLFGVVFPSKFYSIVAAGVPVLAVGSTRSQIHAMIEKHQLGISVGGGDPTRLAMAFLDAEKMRREQPCLLANYASKQIEFTQKIWNADRAVEAYAQILGAP